MRGPALVLLLLLLAMLGAPVALAGDPDAGDVYVRRQRSIAQTVGWLEREAARLEVGQVLVAFDAATFAPPPGVTEFSMQYAFYSDLPAWLEALGGWGARLSEPVSLRATSSLAPFSVDLTEAGAVDRVRELVQRKWWDGDAISELELAARWMKRLLDRADSARRAAGGRRERMLVLVTGAITPERWIPAHRTQGYESGWRTKLRPLGEYFDERVIGTLLQRQGCRLYVVAPEAYFGDATPLPELPPLPWASRPQFPPDDLLARLAGLRSGLIGAGRNLTEELRRRIDESLKRVYPDPEERRQKVEEMLERMRNRPAPTAPTTPGTPPPRAPAVLQPEMSGLRFIATTPLWFEMVGGSLPFNNHAPSGYGIWPFARVAAKTGGKYVFYPFPETRWLDVCPADFALVNRLAPELVNRQRFVTLRKGDAARDAIGRACELVVDPTPWADFLPYHRDAQGWTAFLRTRSLRLEKDVHLRRLPFDQPLSETETDVALLGERIAEAVLPRYDEAMTILDTALEAVAAGEDVSSHPRSVADLALTRFWFAMSAFHLHAFSIYARELDRFIPESMRGHVDIVMVTYVPTIRLSDCLPGYGDRSLTLADETEYERWAPEGVPGYQGNLLQIPAEDPNYRAQRPLASVLRYLDRRLRRRAEDMIHAARRVMRSYAKSGWGWSTYYADAYTFVFWPVEVPTGHRPTRGGGRVPSAPTTPRGPGSSGGGSSPGGPRSGR